MSVESYAHIAAKGVVMSWLDAAEGNMLDDIYACCLGTNWLTPQYWLEYPILPDGTGLKPAWSGVIPSFQDLCGSGRTPAVIFDIAVCECGPRFGIRTGIEVVHKNPPSAHKLRILRGFGLTELLVLPAAWILGQVAPPKNVPGEFWVWR